MANKEWSDYIKSVLIEIANDNNIEIKEFQSDKEREKICPAILTGINTITIKYFKDPKL